MVKIAALPVAALLMIAACVAHPGPASADDCRATKPAYRLTKEDARALYACIGAALDRAYDAVDEVPGVPDYTRWRVVSSAPLPSATHGSQFVTHIVNPVAEPFYTRWEGLAGERFPPGAIVVKESFRVLEDGRVEIGPLFLMEKAAPDAAPETADWLYTRIYPDGRVQRTGGADARYLDFCHDCHAATLSDHDAMFFPPGSYRVAR